EDDLFCQVNLWFTVALLLNGDQPRRIFRVFPPMRDGEDRWDGFGGMDEPGMRAAMAGRVAFGVADLELAKALWLAFKGRDWPRMEALAKMESPCFRDLEAVVAAQIARFPADGSLGRPHRVLSGILAEGKVAFEDIFKEFSRRAGIYGFGDLQVKSLLRELDAAQATGGPDA
ncbi:MAG TPA: DUF1835 domain-containing protein, partial [Bacteroidia bacterium]|nr:DUF1835 domain-containing protein [Bacteroidia bacterium]